MRRANRPARRVSALAWSSLLRRPDVESIPESKRCSRCGESKPTRSFYKHARSVDGLRGQCKDCERSYQQTENGRAVRVAANARYRATSRGRAKCAATALRYKTTIKERGATRYYDRFPERIRAVNALNHAIRADRMMREPRCSTCGKIARTDAHHDDYSKPLDVRWLCRSCHLNHHNQSISL